jgi:hypothetical protein
MELSMPSTLRLPKAPLWVYIGFAAALLVNLLGIAAVIVLMIRGENQQDWWDYVEAGRRAWAGQPIYDWVGTYEFRYSPLAAYAFGLIAPLGIVAWRLVSLASLFLLPRRLGLMALVCLPLWLDLYAGNITTIVFVLAALAIAGNRWAIGGYLLMVLLIPRPLMLPVALWLLWKHPDWRTRFIFMLATEAVVIVLLGSAAPWLVSAISGRSDFGGPFDFGPGRFIGPIWVPIGLALAAWFVSKGRLGYASLAASPYWLPYYPLMLLLELASPRRSSEDQAR